MHVAYNEQTLVSIFWSKRESLSTFSSFFWEHADCECFRQFLEKDVVVVKDFKTIHILRKHLLGERRVIKWQFLLTSSTKNMLTWGRGSQNMCLRNIWMVPLCKVGQIKAQGTTLSKMSLISLHLARNFSGHNGKPILSAVQIVEKPLISSLGSRHMSANSSGWDKISLLLVIRFFRAYEQSDHLRKNIHESMESPN